MYRTQTHARSRTRAETCKHEYMHKLFTNCQKAYNRVDKRTLDLVTPPGKPNHRRKRETTGTEELDADCCAVLLNTLQGHLFLFLLIPSLAGPTLKNGGLT